MRRILIALVILCAVQHKYAEATDFVWTNQTASGFYTNSKVEWNQLNSIPGASDRVFFTNAYPYTVFMSNGANLYVTSVFLTNTAGNRGITNQFNNGLPTNTWSVNNFYVISSGSSAVYSNFVLNPGNIAVTNGGTGLMVVGTNGCGFFNQSVAGQKLVLDNLTIGNSGNSTGLVNIAGSLVCTQYNGNGGVIMVGGASGGLGTLTLSSGSITCSYFYATNNYFNVANGASNSVFTTAVGTYLTILNGSTIIPAITNNGSGYAMTLNGTWSFLGGTNIIADPPVGVAYALTPFTFGANSILYVAGITTVFSNSSPRTIAENFNNGQLIVSNGATFWWGGSGIKAFGINYTSKFYSATCVSTSGLWKVGGASGGTDNGSNSFMYATNSALNLSGFVVGNARGINNSAVIYGGTFTNNGLLSVGYAYTGGSGGTNPNTNNAAYFYGTSTNYVNGTIYQPFLSNAGVTQNFANVSISDTGTIFICNSNYIIGSTSLTIVNTTNSYFYQNSLFITNGGLLSVSNIIMGFNTFAIPTYSNLIQVSASSLYVTNNSVGGTILITNAGATMLGFSNNATVVSDWLVSAGRPVMWVSNFWGSLPNLSGSNAITQVSNTVAGTPFIPTNMIVISDSYTTNTVNRAITNSSLSYIILSNGATLVSQSYFAGNPWSYQTNLITAGGAGVAPLTGSVVTVSSVPSYARMDIIGTTWSNSQMVVNGSNVNQNPVIYMLNGSKLVSGVLSNYGSLYMSGTNLITATGRVAMVTGSTLQMTLNPDTLTNDIIQTTDGMTIGGALTVNNLGSIGVITNSSSFPLFSYSSQSGNFDSTNFINTPDWLSGQLVGGNLTFSNYNVLYFTNTQGTAWFTNGTSFSPVFPVAQAPGLTNNVLFTNSITQTILFSNASPYSVGSLIFAPPATGGQNFTAKWLGSPIWVTNSIQLGTVSGTSIVNVTAGEFDVTNNGMGQVIVGQAGAYGSLTFAAGTKLVTDNLTLGNTANSTGGMSVASSLVCTQFNGQGGIINVGAGGVGTLSIAAGGSITCSYFYVTNNIATAPAKSNSWFSAAANSCYFTVLNGSTMLIASNLPSGQAQLMNIFGYWSYLGGTNIFGLAPGATVASTPYTLQGGATILVANPGTVYSNINTLASANGVSGNIIISNGATFYWGQTGNLDFQSGGTNIIISSTVSKPTGGYCVGLTPTANLSTQAAFLQATNSTINIAGLVCSYGHSSLDQIILQGGTLTNNGTFVIGGSSQGGNAFAQASYSNNVFFTQISTNYLNGNIYLGGILANSPNAMTQYVSVVSISDTGTIVVCPSSIFMAQSSLSIVNSTNNYSYQNSLFVTNGGFLYCSNIICGYGNGVQQTWSNTIAVSASSLYATNAVSQGGIQLTNSAAASLGISNNATVVSDWLVSQSAPLMWVTNFWGSLPNLTGSNAITQVSNVTAGVAFTPSNLITIAGSKYTVNNAITNSYESYIIVSNGATLVSSNFFQGNPWSYQTNVITAGGNGVAPMTGTMTTVSMALSYARMDVNSSTWSNTGYLINGTNVNQMPLLNFTNAAQVISYNGATNNGTLTLCAGSYLYSTGTVYLASGSSLGICVNTDNPTNGYINAASTVGGGTLTIANLGVNSISASYNAQILPNVSGQFTATNLPSGFFFTNGWVYYPFTASSAASYNRINPNVGNQINPQQPAVYGGNPR